MIDIDLDELEGLANELRSAAKLIRQNLKLVPGTATWGNCEQAKACDTAAAALDSLQTELSRKDRTIGIISNALSHAERECAMYRSRAGELENENRRLKILCAEAHQLAGVVGAPLRFLDALGDAANGEIGKRFSGELLPVAAQECDEIAKLQRELEEARKDAAKICTDIGLRWQQEEGAYAAGKKAGAFECAEAIQAAGQQKG